MAGFHVEPTCATAALEVDRQRGTLTATDDVAAALTGTALESQRQSSRATTVSRSTENQRPSISSRSYPLS